MPNFIDIDEDDKKYLVCFDVKGVPEADLVIVAEPNSVRVVASSQSFSSKVTERGMEIDLKKVYYDKTIVLENTIDTESVNHIYFAGILEITINKIN